MSLFATPEITPALAAALAEADALRARISSAVARTEHWVGVLRREVEADAFASSNRIEGFRVDPARAVAVVGGSAAETEGEEALACYTHAMRHVGTMAADPLFEWNSRVILDLHFDACSFQREKHPGLIRKTPISVTGEGGRTAYVGPDAQELQALLAELVTWLVESDADHPLVAGSMAHLNLISLHPFEDGNGRISRILQSLVLVRGGETAAEFGSIEPHLAHNSAQYYKALEAVQAGTFEPQRDASEWLAFCIAAHIEQARLRVSTIEVAATRWQALEALIDRRGWNERLAIALERSLTGGCERAAYADEASVSPATATNDLRRLVDAGLIRAEGGGRSTRYTPTDELRSQVGA